jgi:hypothetical protein
VIQRNYSFIHLAWMTCQRALCIAYSAFNGAWETLSAHGPPYHFILTAEAQ